MHIAVLGAVTGSIRVQTRPGTIKRFTMTYVSTVVEKRSVTIIYCREKYHNSVEKEKKNNILFERKKNILFEKKKNILFVVLYNYSFGCKTFFSLQNNLRHVDLSYKMDLDF